MLPTGSPPSCSEAQAPAHERDPTYAQRKGFLDHPELPTPWSTLSFPELSLMATPFACLSKAVWNALMLPAPATSGGSSIPQIHYLLRGVVFPPTCPELASLVVPRCCNCISGSNEQAFSHLIHTIYRPISLCLSHSPSDSQLLFRASGLHSVTFSGLVYASRLSPDYCRQEHSTVLGGSEIMLFV